MEKILTEKTFQTLSMCDFCSREREQCGAEPILIRDISRTGTFKLDSDDAVVACDLYESPVDLLSKKFH